ncbi:MAG: hypothetical protein PHO48_00610 [Candidatus Gracilibacteria bacterium]|nr:hypothetical protein [Candidatus Gracilibacteria bacterium]MDD5179250.1 hypothetical protein [Candidatus Gracilibacteria bacterium]
MKSEVKHAERIVSNRSEIILRAHYPEDNPKETLEGITNALSQMGVFDGIDKK